MNRVAGYCPACGHSSLIVAMEGHVTCTRLACPDPTAADQILGDPEVEHVVELRADTFTVRHPLRERIGDALFACTLHAWLSRQLEPPEPPGRYRVTAVRHAGWRFQPLPQKGATP